MAKLLISVLFLVTLGAVSAADLCTYYTYSPFTVHHSTCTWSCCVYELDGCCDAPFYVGAGFIAPVVISSVALVVVAIVIIVVRRRRARTIQYRHYQYGTPGTQPHVVTSTTATNANGGYKNPGYPGYPPVPGYAAQPPKY